MPVVLRTCRPDDRPSTHAPCPRPLTPPPARPGPLQVAAKAQKASVTPGEVARYEQYNGRHGARYLEPGAAAGDLDEEDW